ncbi:MAG: hypothetical protein K6L76_06785 [Agarilytica sp.]
MKIITLFISALWLSGCAVGVKHDYEVARVNLGFESNATVNVATLDHRPYVRSGDKSETFVGLSRGGLGNPFDINTRSGESLADDISDSIVGSLNGSGMRAKKVLLKPSQSLESAFEILPFDTAHRSLLFQLIEWKGDSMANIAFLYDFEVYVLNEKGETLVKKHYKAREKLGSADPFNPGGGGHIHDRFRQLISELFSNKEIKSTLVKE